MGGQNKETLVSEENMETENLENVLLTNEIRELENGLSAVNTRSVPDNHITAFPESLIRGNR